MEPRYLWLLYYPTSEMVVIKLTNEEIKESEKYDSFEYFIEDVLEPKYEFSLNDCQWMVSESYNIQRRGF